MKPIPLAFSLVVFSGCTPASKSLPQEMVSNVIPTALVQFRIDMGRFPTNGEGLRVLATPSPEMNMWRGPYIDPAQSLTDPWGTPYGYSINSIDEISVFSLGPDRVISADDIRKDQ